MNVSELDTTILEAEAQAVQADMYTFLRTQVLETQRHVVTMMDEMTHHLRCVKLANQSDGRPELVDRSTMVFMETEDKSVVGSLKLRDCYVQDLDIILKLTKYNKGANLHYSFSAKTFFLLRQVQTAVHHVEKASDLMMSLDALVIEVGKRNSGRAATDAKAWQEFLPLIRQVKEVCQRSVNLLELAAKELDDWKSRAFPAMPQNWLRMEPPLPPDLLLQLYCENSHLVLRVCVLAMHARCPPNKQQANLGDSCSKIKGRVIPHKGGWIEVLEAVDARSPVKQFKTSMTLLTNSTQRIRDLANNAEALESSVAGDVVQ